MYFTLVLQLLSFVGVQGKMLQCIVGGVDESNCLVLLNGSVLKKYYISSVGKTCKNDTSQKNAELLSSSGSSTSLEKSFDVSLTPNIFLQPYYMNTTDESTNSIASCWQDVLTTGTDVIRLKFHSKLVLMYKNSYTFTQEERFVFLKSCYSASSIYYFAKRSEDALNVLEDGMYFINLIKKESIQANQNIKEISVWSVLYLSFKIEIMKTISNTNIEKEIALLSSEEEELIVLFKKELNGKYPSVYLLRFRQYFLDEDFDQHKKNILYNVVISNSIQFTNNDHHDHPYYSKYQSLVLSLINPNEEEIKGLTSLMHIVDVIKSPIICTEDRLINYKAMQLAKEKIEICFNENEWIYNHQNKLCDALKYKTQFKEDICLSKIWKSLIGEKRFSNINITKNIVKISNNVVTIDEDLLNIIVINAINIKINANPDTFESIIEIVNKSIEVLNNYIQDPKLYIENLAKSDQSKINNRVDYNKTCKIARNWLTELYGILCNKVFSNSDKNCKKLVKLINVMLQNLTISDKDIPNEDIHIAYLLNKYMCRFSNHENSWENTTRPDGWNIPKNNTFYNENIKFIIESGFNMESLLDYYTYINPIEVWIYKFRSEMLSGKSEDAKAAILNALKCPVISCEDRYRNFEASELYSMTFMTHFNRLIDDEKHHNDGL